MGLRITIERNNSKRYRKKGGMSVVQITMLQNDTAEHSLREMIRD